MQRPLAIFGLLFASATTCIAQARPTASRLVDIQVGGGYTTASPDYSVDRFQGYKLYGDFDWRPHYGVELEFGQVHDTKGSVMYERSYEAGGHYLWRYHSLTPYVKGMYGRGVFNFPPYPPPFPQNEPSANLAYNMLVGGGGVDFAVHPRVKIRADFEYQKWLSGPGLESGLTPTLFTIGAAYHFPPGKLRK